MIIIKPPPKLTNRSSIIKYIEIDLWSWLKQLTTNLLKLNSTQQSSSNMVLIERQVVSNASNVIFKKGITIDYNTYMFILSNVVPVNNGASLNMSISANSGVSFLNSGYYTGVNVADYNSSAYANNNSTSVMFLSAGIASSGSGLNAVLNLYNIASSNNPVLSGNGTEYVGINGRFSNYTGYNTTTLSIDAFKFNFSVGNISKGTFSLYGIK